jgi:endoglucanase
MSEQNHQWLMELTGTPTAAGKEDRVVSWIKSFVADRPGLELSRDAAGNIVIGRKGVNSDTPIFIEAHMDHPAFVCVEARDSKQVVAEFRGGVHERFFLNTPVRLWQNGRAGATGVVSSLIESTPKDNFGANDSDKRYLITFADNTPANVGDVITWALPEPAVTDGLLHAPACDDLAGVAAALCAYDKLMTLARQGQNVPDVRLLFTRAEEVGFVGAIAACKLGTIPSGARIIALENSKSYPESPIGSGPIVRVGDYTSTFDPDLTYRVGRIAQALTGEDPAFRFQRKLMPGGTCEASAFQSYGYTATCVCLALGNYHNMSENTGKIAAEFISTDDFDNLVKLLVQTALRLDDPAASPSLKTRLEKVFGSREKLLTPME